MKMIKLLDAAYVGGVLHYPRDGVLKTTEAESSHLIKEGMAEDVTADFDAEAEEAPTIAEAPVGEAPADDTPDTKQARRKAADSKE
ncbi:hypothetical protein [Sphingomonas elodea]|uniref:hypothetical protein n=1 Tax=Sphingomonas elodea TaxID=179878 RepID=UPI00026321B9|nr:hypothetical protein [Sphingomonas elodea]